jgi:hypothetical protein
MKRRHRPKPGPEKKKQIVHLDDLIPRQEIKAGTRKLRFGEEPDRDASKKPEG